MANLIIIHGGAPTAVINASLYGAIKAAKDSKKVDTIYAAQHGSQGVLNEDFINLSILDEKSLEMLKTTPGSAIGTSRTPLEEEDYNKMVQILKKYNIKYVLYTGGNGSMDACGKLAKAANNEIFVCGIPKTIDNDISITDHAPGYPSALRYVAECINEVAQDVKALNIHVCIFETMGRNTGWITAGAALALENSQLPYLIYLPEQAFDEDKFLQDVKSMYENFGAVLVVVSEGLKNKDGNPLAPIIFESGRSKYYGDVSEYLTKLVINKLGIKARNEKPGILGRCAAKFQSKLDVQEAIAMGALAAKTVLSDKSGYMAGLKRISSYPYKCEEILINIEDVMLKERLMPKEFLSENGVSQEFIQWARPLLGEDLSEYVDLKKHD